jgi:hypothetical protein
MKWNTAGSGLAIAICCRITAAVASRLVTHPLKAKHSPIET